MGQYQDQGQEMLKLIFINILYKHPFLAESFYPRQVVITTIVVLDTQRWAGIRHDIAFIG